MKEVLFNYDNLTKNDIDEVVIRVKGLLINSRNEITLGYCNKTYQFPGGHLEEGETLEEGLFREIKEETGIDVSTSDIKLFEKITHYSKNYRGTSLNRQNDIYYYIVKTDMKADMAKASLDEGERNGNYVTKTLTLDDIEQILIDSISDNLNNEVIVFEMLDVINEYKKISNMD